MSDWYILDDDGEPQLCEDLLQWGRWMQTAERIVLQTRVGDACISTVFLGLDHNHFGGAEAMAYMEHGHPFYCLRFGKAILWETMIFKGRFDQFTWRYTSKLDAMRGHMRAVAMVELADDAPRRLKKALRKAAAGSFYDLHRHERRQVERAVTRAMRHMEAAA